MVRKRSVYVYVSCCICVKVFCCGCMIMDSYKWFFVVLNCVWLDISWLYDVKVWCDVIEIIFFIILLFCFIVNYLLYRNVNLK